MKKILSLVSVGVICCLSSAVSAIHQPARIERQLLSSHRQVQTQLVTPSKSSSSQFKNEVLKTEFKTSKTQHVKKAATVSETLFGSLVSKDLGLSNSQQVSGSYWGNDYGVYVGFEQNSGTNIPAYYDLGESIRIYKENSVNFISQYSNIYITDVRFTFYQNNCWTDTPVVSTGSYSISTQSWSGYTHELSITTSQKVFIQQIDITFVIESDEPDPDPDPSIDLTPFIYKPSEWTYMGEGEFKDAWFNNFWNGGDAIPFNVPVYQNNNNKDLYLISNPYGPNTPYADVNVYSATKPGYIVFNVTNPNCVLVRPLVYAATFIGEVDGVQRQLPIYATNLEGYNYAIGASYEDIIMGVNQMGSTPSTYNSEIGRIDFKNACYAYIEQLPCELYGNKENNDGYLLLPGFINDNSDNATVTFDYHISGTDEGVTHEIEVNLGSDDMFDVTLNNIDRFKFKSSLNNINSGVNLYESTLGMNLPVVYTLETQKPYVYTPWAGNYRIRLSKDLSIATVTTTTPKPDKITLYLPGDYNNWSFDTSNKFSQISNGVFSFTVPEDINGSWKIGSQNWQYDYSYAGAVNPADTYEFVYNTTENTTLPLKKGDIIKVSINTDIYNLPAIVNIVRSNNDNEEPPVSGDTKTVDINGVVYTLYPSEGYFMATDGSQAQGEVTLITSTENLSLRGVASGAFRGNNTISSITIPEGVSYIGDEAFRECENLQIINLPSTLSSIGQYAFLDCSYLNIISLPSSVTSIGIGAFQNCTDLEVFKFNDAQLTELPDAIFEGTQRLSEVNIPSSVKKIGANAFFGSGVVKIGNTTGVTSVGARAFEECELAQFDFNSMVSIGASAFAGTKLKVAVLPSSLMSINEQAFQNCDNLAKLTLPSKLKEISKSTFEGCEALTSVEIPESVTAIWDKAFYNSGLVNVTISNNVTELGANAFVTNSLTSVYLGSGIHSLENSPIYTEGLLHLSSTTPPTLGSDRLGCTPTVVIVPKGAGTNYRTNTRWKQYNIIEEDDEVVIYLSAPGALTADLRIKQVMPAQVTSLVIKTDPSKGTLNDADWKSIKSNMKSLIKLNIAHADVQEIPDECFMNKTILTQVVLPKNLKVIGQSAFEGCTLLETLNLPSTVTAIGSRAFAGCNSIKGNVVIPPSCSKIEAKAFSNCYAIDNVIINSDALTTVEERVFENCRNLDEVVLPSGVRIIRSKAFAETGITNISLPESLTTIEDGVFEGCFYLAIVDFPSNVTSIGNRAFAKSGLIGVSLPATIDTIEDETFEGCDNLRFVNLSTELTSLGARALASPSISAISSPAKNPPLTGYEPFEGINTFTCTLSIPAFSFNDYISAQYWGSFVGVHDNIDVEISGNPIVTYMDEEDYKALLSNDRLNSKKKALPALSIKSGSFAHLFNGAQMFVPEKAQTRFFFEGEIDDYIVEYNGVDVTPQIDRSTNSWLSPAMNGSSRLKIIHKDSSVTLTSDDKVENRNIYDITGRLIMSGTDPESMKDLTPGCYIIGNQKVIIK